MPKRERRSHARCARPSIRSFCCGRKISRMRFATCLLLVTVCAPPLMAQPQRASVAQWRADIDYLASELPKRHPDPFTLTPRQDFLTLLTALKGDVPLLADVDIVQRLQIAVAS